MLRSRFVLEKNFDSTSPQKRLLRFVDAQGVTSAPITSVVTQNKAVFSFEPSEKKRWFFLVDGGKDCLYLEVRPSSQTETSGPFETSPIISIQTQDGRTRDVFFDLTHEAEINPPTPLTPNIREEFYRDPLDTGPAFEPLPRRPDDEPVFQIAMPSLMEN